MIVDPRPETIHTCCITNQGSRIITIIVVPNHYNVGAMMSTNRLVSRTMETEVFVGARAVKHQKQHTLLFFLTSRYANEQKDTIQLNGIQNSSLRNHSFCVQWANFLQSVWEKVRQKFEYKRAHKQKTLQLA